MNSSLKNAYQAYATATQTVAKTQQIIMLYDGTINLLKQAKEAIEQRRIEDRYNLLMKASYIIHGLQGCLDFENGGEIAGVLFSFYSSVDARLFAIQRTNSLETCDEVIADLKQMRDAWVAVDQSTGAGAGAILPQTEMDPAATAPASPQNITLSA